MAQMSKRRTQRAARGADCCGGLASLLSPRLFRALADPKRLSLLLRLAEQRGPRTVSQVAGGSGVDLSVVSRHLAILRDAGIIGCVKRGKEVWCTVQTTAVADLLRELADALETCCPEGSCPPAPGRSTAAAPSRKPQSRPPR
jgi:DNA-binding transcriptional ArsR family regulator